MKGFADEIFHKSKLPLLFRIGQELFFQLPIFFVSGAARARGGDGIGVEEVSLSLKQFFRSCA